MAAQKTKNGMKKFLTELPKLFFVLQILLGVLASFWVLFNHQPKTGDDVEHLHSAWLVYQGQIPYIDFFQHHNPLMWYLFAPLVGFFAYKIVIFDIVRIISTLVMFLTLYVAGKIVSRFICHAKYAGLLTIASVFPSYVIFSGQDFRPDNYMVCAFLIGLYFLFSYLENKKLRDLNISFIWMFITFMFLQKSVFFLVVVGICVVYLLYTKQILFKDFLIALIIPLIGVVAFILWLAYHNMIERYWVCNFIFNLHIPDVYNKLCEKTAPEFYGLTLIAFAGFIYYIIQGTTISRILCILWLNEVLQRFFYFSLDRHYYYLLAILNAMLAGAFIWQVIKRWNLSSYIFVFLSILSLYQFNIYCQKNKLLPEYHRYVTPRYIVESTNKCDYVLNGYGLTYGIFTKDITYYWNLNGQLDVIGNKIGLAPLPDLNAAVEKYLPRIIYTGTYWDEKNHQQKKNVKVHQIDEKLRDQYYEQSKFVDVFILKPEYANKRRCRYNKSKGTWEYYYFER